MLATTTSTASSREDTRPDDDEYDYPNLRIVGLELPTNGCSCSKHDVCGAHIGLDSVLRLVKCTIPQVGEESTPQEAIKLVVITKGKPTCTVGFVAKDFATSPKVKARINKCVQVLKFYRVSSNGWRKHLNERYQGVATANFIDDIPLTVLDSIT
jgi:hypothetical protein